MRVGVHTSIAGALENAAHHAKKIGCDTFQMFSANPRGWKALEPSVEAYDRFRAARAKYKLAPVVIHDNYLINLAAADPVIRKRSVAAFRREVERAVSLGAEYLVTHPGSAKGSTMSEGIRRCVKSLKEATAQLALDGLIILIENTAGQGSVIGRSFEEVAEIIAGVKDELSVGACIDTAHCFEAGYPIHTQRGLAELVKLLELTIGMANVKVIHANDSKTPFASHADRHEHIGRGYIGQEGFRRIVQHPQLQGLPFICETPVDRPGDDKRNVRMIRKLAGEV